MAAQPPPYSPRDYRRAQREQARAQSYYWKSLRRPSILGPLVLIAVGIVALLVELGKLAASGVWDWYLRWWPLLLIALGLISLGEWWLDRDSPYARRRRYGGVLLLLFLLLLIAMGERNRFLVWNGSNLSLHFPGEQHWSSYTTSRQLAAGSLIQIQAPRGDVTVVPSGDNQIHVQEEASVYAPDDDAARRALDALRPQLDVNGTSVTLRTVSRDDGRANLSIGVPADAVVSVTSGGGAVVIEDLTTPVNVISSRGNVSFLRLKADAHARMSHGDFSAQSVAKDVSVQGRVNNVTISDLGGSAFLEGLIVGDLDVSHVASSVHLQTGHTEVTMASLPGDFSFGSGNLRVDGAAGPLAIKTRAKDIRCTIVSGDVNIENKNGEVALQVAGQPGGVRIVNQNGTIELTLPPNARFNLQATAKNGDISSAFPLPVNAAGRGHVISGQIGGGGATIELIADHGDIRIAKGETSAHPDGNTQMGGRRLRAPRGTQPVIQTQ